MDAHSSRKDSRFGTFGSALVGGPGSGAQFECLLKQIQYTLYGVPKMNIVESRFPILGIHSCLVQHGMVKRSICVQRM